MSVVVGRTLEHGANAKRKECRRNGMWMGEDPLRKRSRSEMESAGQVCILGRSLHW